MRVERISFPLLCTALSAVLLLAGCDKKPPPAPPPGPQQVGVVTVQPQSVPVSTELSGRVNPVRVSEVRARVNGIVLKREFREGSQVRQGQRLFKIDPAPYVAQLNNARAALAKARANQTSTSAQAQRYKVLVAANAISKQDYDNAVASQGQSTADVAAAQAAIQTAQINLGYTDVTAPISGQIGIAQVTEGAYVQSANATLMATVQQIDPVYVDVTQSTSDLLRLRREAASGQLQMAGPGQVKVNLVLEDGSIYPATGTFQFSDISVNQGTGSVTVRAAFPNPDRMLLPGMFVRARITEGTNNSALLVPVVGITHDQKGQPNAFVVGPDNKIELRELTTSHTIGDKWVVESGLKAGDRVVVDGVQKVRPGMVVQAVAANMAPPARMPGGRPAENAATGVPAPTGGASSAAGANAAPQANKPPYGTETHASIGPARQPADAGAPQVESQSPVASGPSAPSARAH